MRGGGIMGGEWNIIDRLDKEVHVKRRNLRCPV